MRNIAERLEVPKEDIEVRIIGAQRGHTETGIQQESGVDSRRNKPRAMAVLSRR
jgi:hypothetical protein